MPHIAEVCPRWPNQRSAGGEGKKGFKKEKKKRESDSVGIGDTLQEAASMAVYIRSSLG